MPCPKSTTLYSPAASRRRRRAAGWATVLTAIVVGTVGMLNAPVVEQALAARTGDRRLGMGWGVLGTGVAGTWLAIWVSLQRDDHAVNTPGTERGAQITDPGGAESEAFSSLGEFDDPPASAPHPPGNGAVDERVTIVYEPRHRIVAIVRRASTRANDEPSRLPADGAMEDGPGGGA